MRHTNLFPALLLYLFCCLLMSACNEEKQQYVIGVSQCSDDEWRTQMNKEIRREALFYPGVEIDIRSAGDDNNRQIADIEHFISQDVDLIVVAPNEAEAITPVVEKAYKKGIPVVLVDRKIDSDSYNAYIGADNYEMGRQIGIYLSSRLKGKGNVVELSGLKGSTPGTRPPPWPARRIERRPRHTPCSHCRRRMVARIGQAGIRLYPDPAITHRPGLCPQRPHGHGGTRCRNRQEL